MFFAIVAADKPDMQALRAETKDLHRQHLDSGASRVQVLQSGPLLSADGKEQVSLIVVSAGSLDEVREFVDRDPYNRAGLFANVDIREWHWRRGNPYLT
jgi:uncharacterized protein YciI